MSARRGNKRVMLLASGDLWAGAEAVVYQLATGLREYTETEVTTVLLNHGRLEKLCKNAGIETHVVDENKLSIAGIIRNTIRIGRTLRPHIIHSHRYKENLVCTMIAPRVGFPKLVSTVHGRPEVSPSVRSILTLELDKFLWGIVFHRIVAVSDDAAKFYKKFVVIPANKVVRIYNGINVAEKHISHCREREIIQVGSAGRLFPVKDYLLMVEVAKNLCAKIDYVRFLLAGTGPQLRAIRERIDKYGLMDRFKLLGDIDDMASFYNSIDIYINTSRYEGMPMGVLEAMNHGIPAVAPLIGSLPEIIDHGKDGFLVGGRKLELFCEYLNKMIDSPDMIKIMGRSAKEKVREMFSTERMVKAYDDLYNVLLES